MENNTDQKDIDLKDEAKKKYKEPSLTEIFLKELSAAKAA